MEDRKANPSSILYSPSSPLPSSLLHPLLLLLLWLAVGPGAFAQAPMSILGRNPNDQFLAAFWSRNLTASNLVVGINTYTPSGTRLTDALLPSLLTGRFLSGAFLMTNTPTLNYWDGTLAALQVWSFAVLNHVPSDTNVVSRIGFPEILRYKTLYDPVFQNAGSPLTGILKANGASAATALSGVSGANTVYLGTNYFTFQDGVLTGWSGSTNFTGAGLQSLNGDGSVNPTFATGTSGTDLGINTLSGVTTVNLPTASATARGALSSADWSTFNSKQAGTDILTAVSALSGTGVIAKTGTSSLAVRTLTGGAGITIDNADGLAGNPEITVDTAALTNTFLPLAGGTLTGALTLSGAPSSDLHAATKAYADALAQGVSPKNPVAVATTANITLSGEQTLDGVLTSTSRVLVKNQTAPAENGIYGSAAGAWARATDMDAWAETEGAFVLVSGGTTQGSTGWASTTAGGGTLNTTDIVFVQMSAPGAYTAGAGLGLSGNQFSFSGTTLVNNQTLWDSSQATRTLTAGLSGSSDPILTFADNELKFGVVNRAIRQYFSSTGSRAYLLGGYDMAIDATARNFSIGTSHYTIAEEPFIALNAATTSSANTVSLGGGVGQANAATVINFYTAPDTTTLTGSAKMFLDGSGNLNIAGLTASRVVATDSSKNLVSSATTGTELGYLSGVTSALQTQLDAKAPLASPTFTGTVTLPTPWTLGAVSVLPTGTELNFVDGVTSSIQTQLDGKAATSHAHAATDITSGTLATARLGSGTANGNTMLLGDSTWALVPGTEGGGGARPTISFVPEQFLKVGGSSPALSFTVGDDVTAAGDLIVTATSSDTALIPNANLFLGGSGASRLLQTVAASSSSAGTVRVTLTATDGDGNQGYRYVYVNLLTPLGTDGVGKTYTAYDSGGVVDLTTSSAAVSSVSTTLAVAGKYLLHGSVTIEYVGATYAANQTVTVKLRKTNGTPADVATTSKTLTMDVVTTKTATFQCVPLIGEITAAASDVVQIFGSVSALPSAGSVRVSGVSLYAVRVQ